MKLLTQNPPLFHFRLCKLINEQRAICALLSVNVVIKKFQNILSFNYLLRRSIRDPLRQKWVRGKNAAIKPNIRYKSLAASVVETIGEFMDAIPGVYCSPWYFSLTDFDTLHNIGKYPYMANQPKTDTHFFLDIPLITFMLPG